MNLSTLFFLTFLILFDVFLFLILFIRLILEVSITIVKWFLKHYVFWIIIFVVSIFKIWSWSRLFLTILNRLKLRYRLMEFNRSWLRNSRNMPVRNWGQLTFLLWTSTLIVFIWLNVNLLIINRALISVIFSIFVHI